MNSPLFDHWLGVRPAQSTMSNRPPRTHGSARASRRAVRARDRWPCRPGASLQHRAGDIGVVAGVPGQHLAGGVADVGAVGVGADARHEFGHRGLAETGIRARGAGLTHSKQASMHAPDFSRPPHRGPSGTCRASGRRRSRPPCLVISAAGRSYDPRSPPVPSPGTRRHLHGGLRLPVRCYGRRRRDRRSCSDGRVSLRQGALSLLKAGGGAGLRRWHMDGTERSRPSTAVNVNRGRVPGC